MKSQRSMIEAETMSAFQFDKRLGQREIMRFENKSGWLLLGWRKNIHMDWLGCNGTCPYRNYFPLIQMASVHMDGCGSSTLVFFQLPSA